MKPFLKWAGGKTKLVGRIGDILPSGGNRLVEPFVGSGAVFMGLQPMPGGYLLGDANPDLLMLYRQLVEDSEGFCERVARLFTGATRTPEGYYALREAFNALPPGSPERAPIFVYLNRHAFNGLYRVNRSGAMNVPWGNYTKSQPPIAEMLAFAKVASHAEFCHADFRVIMDRAVPGDIVYCDPPYVALSATAAFDAYAAGRFTARDQQDLADRSRALAARGIPVLVSNHDTPAMHELYEGAEIVTIDVRRSVSASAASRRKVSEVLAMFHAAGSAGEAQFRVRQANSRAPSKDYDAMAA